MAYISFQPKDFFNTVLYTGNSTTTNAITGVNFQPDWVWLKARNFGDSHRIYDAVRGSSNYIVSNATIAQNNLYPLTSFDSDGFTIGSADPSINGAYNYVSWNWLAGNGTVSNTDGSITSTVSANTTSGFSIVTYTGTGSNATVGHGLGSAPSVVIVKQLNAVQQWINYHKPIGAGNYLHLNAVDASASGSTVWNSTDPTSSVFSVGTAVNCNQSSGTYVAYCFAEVKGFSKFGSYKSNYSTDGPFIYTGFKPAFVLCKVTDTTTNDWTLLDSARDTYNVATKRLYPNSSVVESSADRVDFLSNGFKLRGTGSDMNGPSGYGYIYMAFAEEPLVTSNGLPATAR